VTTNLPAMRGLLIDLDGTLYHGDKKIKDADLLIHYLQETAMPYRYVTNNSSATPEAVAARLKAMGIPAEAEHVCTSAQAAAAYIAEQSPGASVFVVGEDGLRRAVSDAGLRLTAEQPDYVLQGIDRAFTYERLAQAVRFIHEGATFVMTNPDLLLPSGDGLIPGAGSIGAMLRAAGGKEPILIGKPSSVLMQYSLASIGLAADEAWVIGDNMATDIAFGKAAGCGSLLVLTGLTTEANMAHYIAQAGCEPDIICNDLQELRDYIANHRAV
jgi:4-nitrophenyl phosphatase